MAVIESIVGIHSEQFAQNREGMLECIADFRAIEDKVRATEESKRERFTKRGQILSLIHI